MSGSSFGKIFRITTWGESHGAAVGVLMLLREELGRMLEQTRTE